MLFRSQTPEDEDLLPLAEVHRRHALKVLDRVEGNKARAAKILGIHRATLYRLIEGERIEPAEVEGEPE